MYVVELMKGINGKVPHNTRELKSCANSLFTKFLIYNNMHFPINHNHKQITYCCC